MYENKTDNELVDEAGKYRGTIDRVPVEMMRRLKESTEKLNKSIVKLEKTTSRYSQALILLTLILAIIGIWQLVITLASPQGWWKFVYFIVIFSAIILIIKKLKKLDVGSGKKSR